MGRRLGKRRGKRQDEKTVIFVRGGSQPVSLSIGSRPPWWQHLGWLLLVAILALAAGLISFGAADQAAALGALIRAVFMP